jgi:NADH-quinone oxidoreductase subunit H
MEIIYAFFVKNFPALGENWARAIAIAVPILFIITIFPLIFAVTTLVERKTLARMQNRYGPNRVGRWGILQPIADGLKLLFKENIVPETADKLVHFLAPVLMVIPALLLFSVIPVGKNLVPVDLNIGILFVFAIATPSALAMFMGGWASRNKYSILGAMRSVAQLVSYEVPMVLAAVAVIMIAGSLSTISIVEAQKNLWFVLTPWGFVGFFLFFIAGLAEAGRSPFDIPEGESEIIAGYHTEYSGFKFALFQLGEYLSAIATAGLAVTMFLGGWYGPGVRGEGFLSYLLSIFWFFFKLSALIFVMIWLRGTFPRLRVDQLMGFAWKFLLPLSMVNIVAAAVWHRYPQPQGWFISAIVLLGSYFILSRLNATKSLEKRVYRYA